MTLLMNVGSFRVFFRAETDATDERGNPVEIKASNPRYWGTKVMFQMISSGSTKLCLGIKSRGSLAGISVKPLQEVAMDAISGRSVKSLEKNIVNGMKSMRDQMASAVPGEAFKVSFVGGSLKLTSARGRSSIILPPEDIMLKLMAQG